jgi:exopolyphosphatase/guanosine-5'-triphosphate,3'-diphosphate pyrophosphatase
LTANDDAFPLKTAIVDLGSNSFRLIVVSYVPGRYFHVTDEVRETVRVVHGLGATGILSDDAMDKAARVMKLYRSFCDTQGIRDIVAVATSAIREAKNGRAFVERVRRETGIAVDILSGVKEAYYGYLAAVNSTTLKDGFVLDLGGGSLEITRVESRRTRQSVSRLLGSVRMTEDWVPAAPTAHADLVKLRGHVTDQLCDLSWFKGHFEGRLVAEGGSLRNLARIAMKRRGYPLDELHGYVLSQADVRKIVKLLEPISLAERRAVPGMKPDRADITLAAAVVVQACMEHAGFSELTVSSQGLREGLFYQRYLPHAHHLYDDVRKAQVLNVACLYGFQQDHAEHVAHLALSLFDQLAGHIHCGAAERELLWAACMLHDIGMNVDYNDHHRHSYYLILNSGLPGYTHRELALIALLCRWHRKGTPSAGALDGILHKCDLQSLLEMTVCLRLAEQLDRSRDGSVRSLELRWTTKGPCILKAIGPRDISVELWAADRHTDAFEAAFGRELRIEQASK